jgi:hypothetical protein
MEVKRCVQDGANISDAQNPPCPPLEKGGELWGVQQQAEGCQAGG